MKRRVNYYASRKNILTWLASLLTLFAAYGYIANVTCGKGAGVCGATIWLRVVLPVLAALYFSYQLLMHGEECFYRMAVPFWMLLLSYVYATFAVGLAWYWVTVFVLLDLCLAYLMGRILTGTVPMDWLVIVLAGIPLGGVVWMASGLFYVPFRYADWLPYLPDLCRADASRRVPATAAGRPRACRCVPEWRSTRHRCRKCPSRRGTSTS